MALLLVQFLDYVEREIELTSKKVSGKRKKSVQKKKLIDKCEIIHIKTIFEDCLSRKHFDIVFGDEWSVPSTFS